MKKFVLCSLFLATTTLFADNLTLDNQTIYPSESPKTKISIQWASTGKEVDEENKALMYGTKLNQSSLQVLTQSGKINLSIPKKAEHFRVIVWSKGEGEPDLVTNWVDVVPNKTYTLKTDHLVSTVLMIGSGC